MLYTSSVCILGVYVVLYTPSIHILGVYRTTCTPSICILPILLTCVHFLWLQILVCQVKSAVSLGTPCELSLAVFRSPA